MSPLDPDAFDAITRHGPPALAWEVLRRDLAYRVAFGQLPGPPHPGVATDPAFTALWGLHFP